MTKTQAMLTRGTLALVAVLAFIMVTVGFGTTGAKADPVCTGDYVLDCLAGLTNGTPDYSLDTAANAGAVSYPDFYLDRLAEAAAPQNIYTTAGDYYLDRTQNANEATGCPWTYNRRTHRWTQTWCFDSTYTRR